MSKEVTISIVIPCFNEEKYIEKCITSLFRNGYDNTLLEIIVVDGGSFDGTLDVLKEITGKYQNVRVVHNEARITPKSLNIGIANASYDYVMIASAHSDFEVGYISELVKSMVVLDCQVVGGVMETKVLNKNIKSNSIVKVLSSSVGVGNSLFRTGVKEATQVDTVPFGIYKKKILIDAGGYDEKLIRNHDIELSKRLLARGEKIYLVPSAKCNYYARETFREVAQNNFRNGKWNILTLYITKNIESLSLRHFVPLFFVGSIFLPLLLSFFYSPFLFLSIGILLFYLTVITLVSYRMKDEFMEMPYLVWGFIKLHFSYGFGMMYGVLHLNKLKG